MTRKQFTDMIALAESSNKPKTVGDNGYAGGMYQMHWSWRIDYWPEWAWEALAVLDRAALEHFIGHDNRGFPRAPQTAKALADLYNQGHPGIDQKYDDRCLAALKALKLDPSLYTTIVE